MDALAIVAGTDVDLSRPDLVDAAVAAVTAATAVGLPIHRCRDAHAGAGVPGGLCLYALEADVVTLGWACSTLPGVTPRYGVATAAWQAVLAAAVDGLAAVGLAVTFSDPHPLSGVRRPQVDPATPWQPGGLRVE